MKNFKLLETFLLAIILSLNIFAINAEEKKIFDKTTEYNLYTGMFDFSDNGKKSTLVGIQHQNEELNRDTFLGNLSPITGAMMTADSATYVYTGVQAQYELGKLNLTPSFTPGLYGAGDGKDLGHMVEFKSEVQVSLDLFTNSELGFSYNHISNASLGDKNPGANSYMFNFLKKF
jgi:lipid A 3-O-deacylase